MAKRLVVATAVLGVLVGLLSGCAGEPAASSSDDPPKVRALSAQEVGGTATGRGPDVLSAAAPCGGDGPFLWQDAADGSVRSYERRGDGATDSIVVGAWPMTEDAADEALGRIDYGASCSPNGVTIEGVSGFDAPARAIEVRTRQRSAGAIQSWSKRAYSWSDGYLVTTWVTRTNSEPSSDLLRSLLREQQDLVSQDG